VPDGKLLCPPDKVNRQFHTSRPNELWVSDFTYVSTWQGWLYVAFVIDVFARRIVGWRVSNDTKTDFVLRALERAMYAGRSGGAGNLIQTSDCGSQYVSVRYTERLVEVGVEPLLVAKETATITLWLRPSTSYTKRNWCTRDHGGVATQ